MYMVISKPKRMSTNEGVVQVMINLQVGFRHGFSLLSLLAEVQGL